MADETILSHVADIVAAHVANNSVSANDLPGLISSIYASLSSLGQARQPEPETRTPAVSVRTSVKPEAISCLDCGVKMKMLKRHLMVEHGLTIADYRARWKLPADYPVVAPDYAAKRKELAVKNGLGRKPGQSAKTKAKAKAAASPAVRKKLGVAFGSG